MASENSILEFSYLGFVKQTATVGKTRVFNISMKEDAQQLGEIVVVGYGTQKKENLTGAVAQIDSKAFEMRPVTSVATALQGMTAGG